jgi:lipopolysaccharide transport system permease protein
MIKKWFLIYYNHWYLIREFLIKEIKGRFAGSFAGRLWLFINPISQILVYIFLFSIVLKIKLQSRLSGTDSFVIYLLTGMFPWLAFSESIMRSMGILMENASIIQKVAFPVNILPFVAETQAFFTNGIGFLLFLFYLVFKGFLTINWIYMPFILIAFYLFTLGFSLILSSISVYIKDLQHILNIFLFVWFYGTPIIYPEYMIPKKMSFILYINPIYPFIYNLRCALLNIKIDYFFIYLMLFWTVLIFWSGLKIFDLLKDGFSDVI